MANLSLTRVNQKLMQAKLLLQGIDEQSITPVYLAALLEGAAFHLMCAHQHYLRELAENYGLKNIITLRSEQDLIGAFESVKKYAVEAQELADLRKDSASWLSQLQSYYDSLWKMPVRAETQDNENLISVVNADAETVVAVDLNRVRRWQSDFAALVLRQRETSAEF